VSLKSLFLTCSFMRTGSIPLMPACIAKAAAGTLQPSMPDDEVGFGAWCDVFVAEGETAVECGDEEGLADGY
jgi:hypothetical protein